ncbi:MAG TPA: ABC transporter ATP-binding protein [Sporichthyaceae bacterium]|nr:ABC transporter ATP-binding protein [Sporichthyaceae bacterium]
MNPPSTPAVGGGWLRQLWAYLRPYRHDVGLALGAAVLGSVGQAAVPLITRQIVDEVIVARTSRLWPWLTALIALAVVSFGLAYIRRYRGGRVGFGVQNDLRNRIQAHLQSMDLATLDGMSAGQVVARAGSDVSLVQSLLNYLPLLSGNVVAMLVSLGVMIYLSPLLAAVSVSVLPGLFVVTYRMRRRIAPATWDAQQRQGELIDIVVDDVTGVRVVKAFAQEAREIERVAAAAGTVYGSRMRLVRLQSRYQPLLETIPALAQVAVLALGGWLALHHRISLGTFLAFSSYIGQFVHPARQLASVLTIAQHARAGLERIQQLLDLVPKVREAPDAVELPTLRGEITFDDVHFGYGPDRPVLQGFDLHIRPGERVALVGRGGSGKSTAAALVSRLHDPDSGRVLLDSHDVRGLRLQWLRSRVAIAFEDSFLFSDTVEANIGYGRPGASTAQIEAAARAAAAHEFIRELPDGYATRVGERGLTLSGGQRQRVALARAILADPAVLILDDATSAVDSRTEQVIHDELRAVLAGRTTILIAHRLSTLGLADRIVVVEDGRVVEDGTHEELTVTSARYRSLLSGLEDEESAPLADRNGLVGVTATAWARRQNTDGVVDPRAAIGRGRTLAASPELLARVRALRPIRDLPALDVAAESQARNGFSLFRLLLGFRRPLLIGLALIVADALAGLATPLMVKIGIDHGVARSSTTVLFAVSGLLLLITLADLVVEAAETFVTGRTAERVMLALRIRIWAQLQRLSLDYYEHEMTGRIMTRMTTDVDQFESLIENGLVSALVSFVTFLGVGVALLVINPELGGWTLTVVVPLAVATVTFRRRATALYEQSRDRIAVINAEFQESLSGVREAQAFAHEAATTEHFQSLGRHYLDSRLAAQRLVALYFPFVQLLSAVADAIVLGVGVQLIGSGRLTTGALMAFILYVDMFFDPIQALSQVFDSWQQSRVSINRITGLMGLSTLTPNPEHPVALGRLAGEIAASDVRFSYPAPPAARDEQRRGPADVRIPESKQATKLPEALRGIDLHLVAGETLALVGETGAGKSTMMKLLARFYDPDTGTITVDDGDLRSMDLHAFRTQLGYVPQEAFLFATTIRDNIAYGRPHASDAQIEAAARATGAHDFIAAQPDGYHSAVSRHGRSLSSGQRQLIALARAELMDPAVLLLDEATSNLDLATEALVTAAMHRVARRRTTVIIAHRLQTARTADRIAMMRAGRVVELGTHSELLAAGGNYAAMWQAFEDLAAQPEH